MSTLDEMEIESLQGEVADLKRHLSAAVTDGHVNSAGDWVVSSDWFFRAEKLIDGVSNK